MKILFTGGGSGGHFYPIISIVEELKELLKQEKLLPPELYFMSPSPYDKSVLFEHGVEYIHNPAGKLRRNPSLLSLGKNFIDLFRTAFGALSAIRKVYALYPDVVFGKGSYASFPALFAAKILKIPVVIHESDTVPGKVNEWAGKFATRIAVSYREAAKYFPSDRTAYTGQPVRKEIALPITSGAHEFLKLEEGTPVILILGGSQGAEIINNTVLEGLPRLVEKFQIIHQTGAKHFAEAQSIAAAVLHNSPHKDRYKPFDYLNPLALRMAAGASTVIVSRAGSTLFEIAAWGRAAVVVPITRSNGNHQRENAFAYARAGAGVVVEEVNFTPNILVAECERLATDNVARQELEAAAKRFYKPEAAHLIAEEILKIALAHEIEA